MRKKDSLDAISIGLAVLGDALAVFGGFLLATWIRFDSGWLTLRHDRPDPLYPLYAAAGVMATVLFVLVFRGVGLYARPQTGRFTAKIPRLVRATALGIVASAVLAFALQNDIDIARLVIGLSFGTILILVLLERYLLFRVEWNAARHSARKHRVLLIGTDAVAVRLRESFAREPMLRLKVVGFLQSDDAPRDPAVEPELVLGHLADLPDVIVHHAVHQVVLTNARLPHQQIVDIILLCERHLITFKMVPDLFRILTGNMDVHSFDDIPLLGVSQWPLDGLWGRGLKRMEDLAGALVGLVLCGPIVALAALAVRATSRGPALYAQERCGQNGTTFRLYKLRTMRVDAEAGTGPVFTVEHDPRVTPVGAFLRRWNIDELPQLWNVWRGEMSLVGPRPERPHFVERFKTDIGRYMWRHVSKPGMTGWAQVNGLRGNTSIEERIKYDLYYLENWSLSFDFKILLRTLFARENAY
jgi:exopolysaccharide biosynthesis polyprenyl glycosylphosphotransferase